MRGPSGRSGIAVLAAIVVVLLVAFVILSTGAAGLSGPATAATQPQAQATTASTPTTTETQGTNPDSGAQTQNASPPMAVLPDAVFTLRTGIADGKMVFLGQGGSIEGLANPTLRVSVGQQVQIVLINGEGAEHDVSFPDFNATSSKVVGSGTSTTLVFRVDKAGTFTYFCTVAGHRAAGMEGKLEVAATPPPEAQTGTSIVRDPADVPAPVGDREPRKVVVTLESTEVEARLANGVTYTYWTFNNTVPGPMLRVRVGDTVEVHLKNNENSKVMHSIDLHAVSGPGGGAEATSVRPGETKSFTFKALNPGLYVYHCATPMVAHHIANGMYGLILVEPEGGLPRVDHEYYVMEGEMYTTGKYLQQGHQDFSLEKMMAGQPEYYVFNGAVGALTEQHPLRAGTGESVRIFFGVGGPNVTSSFHVIGTIFDKVYREGSLTSPPLTDVQTTTVPAGGSTVVELSPKVPGRYVLVDHALSRADRGLTGILIAEGQDHPDIFSPGTESQTSGTTTGSGH